MIREPILHPAFCILHCYTDGSSKKNSSKEWRLLTFIPRRSLFSIFDFIPEFIQLITYFIGGSKIFSCFCFRSQPENELHQSVQVSMIGYTFLFQPKYFEHEIMEYFFQKLQV